MKKKSSDRKNLKEQEEKVYTLQLTKAQAEVISNACELFSRLRIGQFEDILWKIFPDKTFSTETNINTLQAVRGLFDVVNQLLRGKGSNGSSDDEWTPKSRIAWDIHQVVRYRLAWDEHPEGNGMNVHFDTPLKKSWEQPLPTMEKL